MKSPASKFVSSDHELEHSVLNLLRDQSASRRVTVEVADGTVTLRGEVKSFYRRQLLVHGCRRLPGVASVIDELRVEV
jgi:osmotically-inducible protein OsmY